MASWSLSQLSSILLLVAHNATSLNFYCYSVAGTMLLSFILCLSVSLWTEQCTKMRALNAYDSMDPNYIGESTERIISSGSSACTLEPGSARDHQERVGKMSDCLISSSTRACAAEPGSYSIEPDSGHLFSSGTAACAPEPCSDSKGPDCISKNSLIVSEDGTLQPVRNVQEGHKVSAVDVDGQLVSVEVQTNFFESKYQTRNLVKIQSSSGIEATCTPEHGVLMKDDCMGFKEVKAANLVVGAKALIFQALEETITAVTVESACDGVVSLRLESKSARIFAANPLSDKALAMHPSSDLCLPIDCWGSRRFHDEDTHSCHPLGHLNRPSSKWNSI